MSVDNISKALFGKLATDGVVLQSGNPFRTKSRQSYYRTRARPEIGDDPSPMYALDESAWIATPDRRATPGKKRAVELVRGQYCRRWPRSFCE